MLLMNGGRFGFGSSICCEVKPCGRSPDIAGWGVFVDGFIPLFSSCADCGWLGLGFVMVGRSTVDCGCNVIFNGSIKLGLSFGF